MIKLRASCYPAHLCTTIIGAAPPIVLAVCSLGARADAKNVERGASTAVRPRQAASRNRKTLLLDLRRLVDIV